MERADLEGLAAGVIDDWGKGPPVDLLELARDLGFQIRDDPDAAVCGNVIYCDPSQRPERQRWDVGHELSHVILEDAGIPDTHDAVQYLTSCLLLPRIDFLRDVRQVGSNPFRLKERHPHASHEAIARRIVAVMPSVLWVWDRSDETESIYKVVTHGWRWPLQTPTPVERDAMRAAEDAVPGEPVELVGGVIAWRIDDPPWRRILCLADGDVLLGKIDTGTHDLY